MDYGDLANSSAPSISFKPSLSDLPFQITLYYNSLFSLVYAAVLGSVQVDKYFNNITNIAPLIIISIWFMIEPFRLYFGIRGNMKEKVPDLATYLLITVFPQLPVIVYLGFFQTEYYPIDVILGSIMIIFLILSILFGFRSVRFLIKSQTAQFMRLCEMDEQNY